MDKIKIAHIHGGRVMCGVAVHILSLLEELDGRRFEKHLLLLHDGPVARRARDLGITPFIVPRLFPGDPAVILKLGRYLSRMDIDIIHTHTLNGNFYGRLAARLFSRALIVTTVHTYMAGALKEFFGAGPRRRFLLWQNRLTGRWAATFIAPSGSLKNALVGEGLAPGMINVVYNGIRPAFCNDRQRTAAEVRSEFGIKPASFLIATAGRLVKIKNIDMLIKALARLVNKGMDLRLAVIGDGPERGRLEDLAASLDMKGYILFTGWRNDVMRLMQAIDLYVQPSLEESFCYAAVEAMSAGKPVVAFRTGSLPEIVGDHETGVLVDLGDQAGLEAGIMLLAGDRQLAARMAAAGRQRVEENFMADVMAARTAAIYEAIVSGDGVPPPL